MFIRKCGDFEYRCIDSFTGEESALLGEKVSLQSNNGPNRTLLEQLEARGLLSEVTSSRLEEYLSTPRRVYSGVDPSADDIHLGNLVGVIVMRWFQLYGHQPVVLIGGATGMIGDPSGKSRERVLLSSAQLEQNVAGIESTLRHCLRSASENRPIFVNNYDWFSSMGYVEFLRNVGKAFRMGTMLAKESVQSRLNSPEGLSFTEFCYQTMQAYDFHRLWLDLGVTLQLGGSDQWGNITAGIDLSGKLSSADQEDSSLRNDVDECASKHTSSQLHGLVWPLITRKNGQKFGKSESGAIWLSSRKLSAYDFYQYILQLHDDEAEKLLYMLTFVDEESLVRLKEQVQLGTIAPNTPQKLLAQELLLLCRGEEALIEALKVTETLKPGVVESFDRDSIDQLREQLPLTTMKRLDVVGRSLVELLVELDMCSSKSNARKMIDGGGVYLCGQRVLDPKAVVDEGLALEDRWILLGIGKKKKHLIEILN